MSELKQIKDVKQVIVMRTDLNMRKGKMIAQGAHASMKIFWDRFVEKRAVRAICVDNANDITADILLPNKHKALPGPIDKLIPGDSRFELENLTDEMLLWIRGSFTKICVGVSSEEQLLKIAELAEFSGLPCAVIKDNGLTEFGGVPTITCCAIGPAPVFLIDNITGHLKLL